MTSKLSLKEIIENIQKGIPFEAETEDSSVFIKIQDYVPFACFAIHDGHQIREELEGKILLSDYERWYEEDPNTFEFISSLPICIQAKDSRYEYDLNRPPEEAIYDIAWGKKVWDSPLPAALKKRSLHKHANFYKITSALVKKLEGKFGSALLLDVHSYNYQRIERDCPVFNLGTSLITDDRYRKTIDFFLEKLSTIDLHTVPVSVAENDVFQGKGYLQRFINSKFKNTLVLATEIKKVYVDELSGEPYPLIIEKLANEFKNAVSLTSEHFARNYTQLKRVRKNSFLASEVDTDLAKIDLQLFRLVRGIEILNYVNPTNIESSKREFIKSRYKKDPVFRYKQLSIDPFEFKRSLYRISVEKIHDISLRVLYHEVIDSYSDKVDIISSIGTERFKYNSLRYFGEPSFQDVKNAEYLLHFPPDEKEAGQKLLDSQDVKKVFLDVTKQYGFDCKIEISRQITSKVLISNSQKTIRIRQDAQFTESNIRALSEHEIGVHMLTTVNAREQKLKIFRIGLPNNTHTQEGVAILSEYLSGNLTIDRLKILALRVITTELLQRGFTFSQTYSYLMDHYHPDPDQAFYLCARIFRGGGFTKDYVYLSGFRDIYRSYTANTRLDNLLLGKTSIQYLNLLDEMVAREIAAPPHFKTHSLTSPVPADPTLDYILKGLQ